MVSTRKENTRLLYDAIKSEYSKLSSVSEFGVQKYTDDYIVRKIASQFFKSYRTIENVIYGRV